MGRSVLGLQMRSAVSAWMASMSATRISSLVMRPSRRVHHFETMPRPPVARASMPKRGGNRPLVLRR